VPIPSTTAGQVRAGAMVPMVPYGSMIPYAHYHAVMMPVAASAAAPATSSALQRATYPGEALVEKRPLVPACNAH
jgi:hypothetical protein